mgnify:FL=1
MGLASSQARILLLTARKSDLEYRSQAISQRKMNIAMQTQQLATDYSTAMSNRRMKFIYYADGQSGKVLEEDLSYAGLMSENSAAAGDYLIKTTSGKYLTTGSEVERPVKDSDGNIIGVTSERKESEYAVAKKLAAASGDSLSNYSSADDLIAKYKPYMDYVQGASNNSFFQSALRNGSFYLYQATNQVTSGEGENKKTTCTYECVSWSGNSAINDAYDTSDDAAAEAEYESKSLVLSNQDKMLDLELQQIETQHKAIETEYDSVKKVIENNIKVSFKIFS